MGFTTQMFLFVYFPLAVMGIAACRWLEGRCSLLRRWRLADWALAGGGLLFYGWAVFDGIYRLLLYAAAVWAVGRLIQALRDRRLVFPLYWERDDGARVFRWMPYSLFVLWAAVLAALALLIWFRYMGFAVPLWNAVFQAAVQPPSLLAPLGISFITFSACSYAVDIYRSQAPAGSFLDCLLYLSFFPKVISGPIVLWRDFQPQLAWRRLDLDGAVSGLERIMVGFAKKLILADVFGACVADIQSNAGISGVDAPSAWLAVLLYMLQIYYDFAGYSDIAIGLGRLFGFRFQENFNFPYRSRSITEFWRRWHISLGTWFREYVYIPLGGSRRGMHRTLLNLAAVFALTGIWHGAGWNYVFWGAVNGFFVIFERLVREKRWYQRTPEALRWLGTMFVVFLFWELFRFRSLSELGHWLAIMLGLIRYEAYTYTWRHFLDARMLFLVAVAVLGATVLGEEGIRRAWKHFCETKVGFALREVGALLLFAVALLFMVNSNYSPFIYFQY